jgi:predicted phage terminase large subunit-like protein
MSAPCSWEEKANGAAVIQRLKADQLGIIAISPEGGKTARMQAVAAQWQAGDWYVDRNAAWAEAFFEQITMFPNAANEDFEPAGFGGSKTNRRHERSEVSAIG